MVKRMKKKFILYLITIILAVLMGTTLFACDNDEIYNLSIKYESVQLPLGGSLYISNYISYDGKGDLNYSIENTDVLEIKDDKVTGIGVGEGKILVSSEDEIVTMKVYVKNDYSIDVEAENVNATYDGTVKNIFVDSSLFPEGTTIEYYCNQQVFEGTTEPGEYEVSVSVIVPDEYEVNYINNTATLFIDKAVVGMGKVYYNSVSYDYDGSEKVLLLTGVLPDCVTVTYENNTATDAGTYKATASFTVDLNYYYEVASLTARLTINKIYFDTEDYGFDNTTVMYNGEYQYIYITDLPEGLNVSYYVGDTEIDDITQKFIKAGTYEITAKFTANDIYTKNYIFESTQTATFVITKANFVNNLSWKVQDAQGFTYDGNEITVGEGNTICLEGDMPCGVNGEFTSGVTVTYYYKQVAGSTTLETEITDENDSFIDAGTYIILARFTMPSGYSTNYNSLADTEYNLVINKATYDMTDVSYTGEDFTYDASLHTYEVVDSVESRLDGITVKYAINIDSAGYTSAVTTPYQLIDAGNYLIKATFSFDESIDASNYEPIASRIIEVNINRLAIDLSAVVFDNKTFTYDGINSYSLGVSGELPADVQVSYSDNYEQTNAGTYNVIATFDYYISNNSVSTDNYYFTQNSIEIPYTMEAVLTVNKATYLESEIPGYYANGGTYSPDKTLADYTILNEENVSDGYIWWANESKVPTVNTVEYLAYYNMDSDNYNNYSLAIGLDIGKATIDGDELEISSQFIARTGLSVFPSFTLGGSDASDIFNIDIGDSIKEEGTYPVTASFSLKDSVNYILINPPEDKSITIYIYNSTTFTYSGTQLIKYKGSSTIIQILEGTTSISNNAIIDKTSLTEIILPSTLEQSGISTCAIAIDTLTALTTISMPFIGANGIDSFGGIFGVDNDELPENLVYVTVTNDTTINDDAFKNCEYLKSITYSNSVTSIGANAFYGDSALSSVTLGSEITSIGANAFRHCFSLFSLSLPFVGLDINDTTSTMSYLLGDSTGDNVYSNYFLSNLTITGEVTTISDYCFKDMSTLATITLPDSVTSIGEQAFSGVYASVNLNENITVITKNMFYNYMGTSISIPSTVTSIESYAFRGATNLTGLTIPMNVTSIGGYAFKNITCQVSFETGILLNTLDDNVFREYKGSNIVIPSSVTTLGDYAFAESSLIYVNIPSTVTTVGEHIFDSCASLVTISVNNAVIGDYMFYDCDALTTISTTSNLVSIQKYAFAYCDSLNSVLIKVNVTTIGDHAFYDCSGMDSCQIMNAESVITIGDNAFIENLKIYVYSSDLYNNAYPDSYQFFQW
jgi:hypothetical protein